MKVSTHLIEKHLRARLSGDIHFDTLTRTLYSTDASIYQIMPMGVVIPRDKEDVLTLVNFCRENQITLHARGAGSGLSGESLGEGLILDFSKYLDQIIEIDPEQKTSTIQPGVSLDRLNQQAAKFGLLYGPDPASGNRCTFGGITGNNSTGAHSIKYGNTRDHLISVESILSDGTLTRFETTATDKLPGLISQLPDILSKNASLIQKGYPPLGRNSAGYLLKDVAENGQLHLQKLFAGSEGTLGISTEITVGLCSKPSHLAIILLAFPTLGDCGRAVPLLLKSHPSSLELIDGQVIRIAREGADNQTKSLLPADAQGILILEQDGNSADEVREKMDATLKLIESSDLRTLLVKPAYEKPDQEIIWKIRKSTTPLLYKNPLKLEPVEFIDDAAVSAEKLPEYFDALDGLFKKYNLTCAYYGHAGHGELHLRPFMDFKKPEDVRKMEQVADDFFEIIMKLGGTISGEHCDGLLRAGFVPRQYPELFPVFKEVKSLFDPENILNPGKKIPAPDHSISKNLRYGESFKSIALPTKLHWEKDEMAHEAERCNGCAECKNLLRSIGMCPIFKALRVEEASPRAKANLTRTLMSGRLPLEWQTTDEFKRIANLCVNCKMCHLDCPSEVNIPKMMLEARADYVARHGLPFTDRFLGMAELSSRMASLAAPLANAMMGIKPLRQLMQATIGIHADRQLPKFTSRSFIREFHKRTPASISQPVDKVAYYVDIYADLNDPDLGWAVTRLLEHNGVEVIVPPQQWAGMPKIDYGDVEGAKPIIRYNTQHLAEAVRKGYKIICSEPTAALCLKEEYPDIMESEDIRLVAENTWELMDYLRDLHRRGILKTDFKSLDYQLGYHAPCHLKALKEGFPGMELVKLIPGVKVSYINQGCCGIAGTFGFKTFGFEVSMKAGTPLFDGLKSPEIQWGMSECSTCKMQMEQGSGKPCIHPAKVLAQAYHLL